MFEPGQYQLLDFGAGRKLERFGLEVVDRPSPAAAGDSVANPALWGNATARFDLAKDGRGQWEENPGRDASKDDAPWSVRHGDSQLIMAMSASGNVGVFPEQAGNWDWIADQVRHCRNSLADNPKDSANKDSDSDDSASDDSDSDERERSPRVLNLFAYTGGASLAAAAAGAEVTHVDSSGPTVSWAKNNAEASAMADRPIRWIVDDAIKFAARECRRGNVYDGVIADPPTYGHGPKGRPFKFRQHVGELMEYCGELLSASGTSSRFLLFSCHVPGFEPVDAASTVTRALPDPESGRVTSQPLALESVDGRQLAAGVSARWSRQ